MEVPITWARLPPDFIVLGWCFRGSDRPVGVSLQSGLISLNGTVGHPRPDVLSAFPDSPAEGDAGFELRVSLPAGRIQIQIEVEFENGTTEIIFSTEAQVKRGWIPRWCDFRPDPRFLAFQFPAHAVHPPKRLMPEVFPEKDGQPNSPKLSVVTPCYQSGAFLEETISSVLGQGVPLEYVIQDGGSNDKTGEILHRYSQRLTACESAPDDGQADAISRGFAKTTGSDNDIMAWINADDLFLPGAIPFVRSYFAQHPEVDVVYGHRILIDQKSREIGRWFLPAHDEEVLRWNDFVPQETLFWRRRIWQEVGGVDASFRFAMDWDLLLRFQESGALIRRLPYFLGCFRIHPHQKTSRDLQTLGQREIDKLRARTFGRQVPAADVAHSRQLYRFLRRSAWIEFCWRSLKFRWW